MNGHHAPMSVRQRARNARSGVAAAALMYGSNPDAQPEPEPVRRMTRNPCKDNYRSAAEFYAGPSQPGKIRGPPRNEAATRDTVAILLTDEGLMTDPSGGAGGQRGGAKRGGGAGGADGKVPKVPAGERNHIDHACNPTEPEPEWRSGVRVTRPSKGMDAPYYEDLDPKPPRDTWRVTGKRHLRPPTGAGSLFIDPSKPLTDAEVNVAPAPVVNKKTNRANESVNVLCLSRYTAEQLNEPRPTQIVLGARKWTAPDMPPARHPAIAPIQTHAKDEHDVLGTGRWGKPEVERPRGVGKGAYRPGHRPAEADDQDPKKKKAASARGAAKPAAQRGAAKPAAKHGAAKPASARSAPKSPMDEAELARRREWVPPSEIRKLTAEQKKRLGQPNLLKYFDPSVDAPPPPAPRRPHGNRANEQSNMNVEPPPFRPSRGPGAYAKNAAETGKHLW